MKPPTPIHAWAFAWQKDRGVYLTRFVRLTRRDLIIHIEQAFGQTWAETKSHGGCAVKVTVSPR